MQYSDFLDRYNPALITETFTRWTVGLGCLLIVAVSTIANAQTAGQVDAPTRGSYVLGVGDLIRIVVHDEDDLKLETRLDESGQISYPFLGDMPAVGLTVSELESRITEGLRPDYLIEPEVQVTVIKYRDIYINGQVRRPGGYPYSPGLTVQKATALAGGFTERASTRKMYIIRENDSKQGREQVRLDSAISPGDTLIIEEGLF